ncbi:SigE family RNA polymerase sigma factor [Cryptosporangium minutisporangium]|uniref:SigE family RNA polymerase sigma factor n=1 Tax=Cryptosporangium minutisporangium TaxID=113569 RepID=A0ABP6T9I5_9ACTN
MAKPDGFEQFVLERAAALSRYGLVLTGNPHDAADLVQEALVRLRGAWTRVQYKRDPESYVRTTMVRLHISRWRKLRREFLTNRVPEQWAPDPGIVRAGDDIGLWQRVDTLPPRQRAVLVLRYYEGLADEEIAAHLRVTTGTVRSQALRGLRKLRGQIDAPNGSARSLEPEPEPSEGSRHA